MKFNGDRKFGVEIEMELPNRGYDTGNRENNDWIRDVVDQMRSCDIDCVHEDYNHRTRSHWKFVSDASCGIELVSPPLRGREGLEEVVTVCKILDECGATVSRRCGLHVHHDASDLELNNFKRLILFYDRFEDVIDSLVPESRRRSNNINCRPVAYGISPEAIRYARSISEIDALVRTRYSKLNLQAYQRQGTIEFRQHAGTTNGEKIVNWIVFTAAMIDRTFTPIKSADTDKNTWFDFQTVLGMYGSWAEDDLSKAAVKFYRKRRRELAS